MPEKVILPEPTLRRLPWYLAYAEHLLSIGVEYISSTGISKAMNVDPSQIAKDLSFLNLKGKTRIGYEVATLVDRLGTYLGFTESHKACVFGAGSLGESLMRDRGLAKYGLEIVAAFDTNPEIQGQIIDGIEIFSMEDLEEVAQRYDPMVAILTVPADTAQATADRAIASGFKAIWNFTPFRVKVPRGIALANTSIYAHLALIYNRLAVEITPASK